MQQLDGFVVVWHNRRVTSTSAVVRGSLLVLPSGLAGFPQPPGDHLDPYLDAATRCFVRYGVKRTSVQDVAAELGVNRTTIYRQVGTLDQLIRLLIARDLRRLLDGLPSSLDAANEPEALVDLLATIIRYAAEHPVLAKVLRDEPDVIGQFLASDLPHVIARATAAVAPLLGVAMAAGYLAKRDPEVLAESVVRLGITLILAPPPGELEAFLSEMLVPR